MSPKNYDLYYIYDEPIPFGGILGNDDDSGELFIYPVKMKEYLIFMTVAQLLLVDIYSIPDPQIIQMSYLEYIFHTFKDEPIHITFIDLMLRMVLKLDDDTSIEFFRDKNKKPYLKIGEEILLDKEKFDEIRTIIIEQNLLEPPDDKISKKLRESMKDAERIRSRQRGVMAGIEDQMIAVMISTGLKITDIYDMTIRKFMKTLERIDHKMHYEIYLSASLSGFVTFKDKNAIKHWLADLKKNPLAGMMDVDEFEKKVAGATGSK